MARLKKDKYGLRDVQTEQDDRRGCCGCFAKGVRDLSANKDNHLKKSQALGSST